MKLRRQLRNAALSLVAGTVLSVGLTGCDDKSETKSDKPAEVQKTTKSEHPSKEHPAKTDAAKKKPKDHPAH